jgi:biotin carboxyl carrier protein
MKTTIITGKTKTMKNPIISGILLILLFSGCNKTREKEVVTTPKAIVEAVTFKSGSISEDINFQAQSGYQIKNIVLAPIDCYVQKAFVKPGDRVQTGQVLFEIVTKERKATEHLQDTIFSNFGVIQIKANSTGFVSSVVTQTGDFVSAGNKMCEISNVSSLVFTLQVPFEYNNLIKTGATCQIALPDGNNLQGTVKSELGQMNLDGQTRQYVVKPSTSLFIPENLVATVNITTQKTASAQIVPVRCILSDEMMQNFWVMKLVNDSTAVKIHVKTGLKNNDEVEILEPAFTISDRILSEGNYGLPDTALVNVINR